MKPHDCSRRFIHWGIMGLNLCSTSSTRPRHRSRVDTARSCLAAATKPYTISSPARLRGQPGQRPLGVQRQRCGAQRYRSHETRIPKGGRRRQQERWAIRLRWEHGGGGKYGMRLINSVVYPPPCHLQAHILTCLGRSLGCTVHTVHTPELALSPWLSSPPSTCVRKKPRRCRRVPVSCRAGRCRTHPPVQLPAPWRWRGRMEGPGCL